MRRETGGEKAAFRFAPSRLRNHATIRLEICCRIRRQEIRATTFVFDKRPIDCSAQVGFESREMRRQLRCEDAIVVHSSGVAKKTADGQPALSVPSNITRSKHQHTHSLKVFLCLHLH